MFGSRHQKIQQMSHLLDTNDHNFGSKHDNLTGNSSFFIYSTSSFRWQILFLPLKTFKIQFRGVPPLYVFWSVKYTFIYKR